MRFGRKIKKALLALALAAAGCVLCVTAVACSKSNSVLEERYYVAGGDRFVLPQAEGAFPPPVRRQGGVPFQYGQLPLEPPLVRPLQPRNQDAPPSGSQTEALPLQRCLQHRSLQLILVLSHTHPPHRGAGRR